MISTISGRLWQDVVSSLQGSQSVTAAFFWLPHGDNLSTETQEGEEALQKTATAATGQRKPRCPAGMSNGIFFTESVIVPAESRVEHRCGLRLVAPQSATVCVWEGESTWKYAHLCLCEKGASDKVEWVKEDDNMCQRGWKAGRWFHRADSLNPPKLIFKRSPASLPTPKLRSLPPFTPSSLSTLADSRVLRLYIHGLKKETDKKNETVLHFSIN